MTRLRALILCLLLPLGGVISCASSVEPLPNELRSVELGEAFTLRPGETVQIRGTATLLNFGSIDEDSRCPIDALIVCVWEGNARARFWVAPTMGDALNFSLNSAVDPRVRIAGTLAIELRGVTPAARLEPPTPSEYRVEMLVSRVP